MGHGVQGSHAGGLFCRVKVLCLEMFGKVLAAGQQGMRIRCSMSHANLELKSSWNDAGVVPKYLADVRLVGWLEGCAVPIARCSLAQQVWPKRFGSS
jgi:hypothetical protein